MEHETMLDALFDAHGLKGGTIHQFSRMYGVDMTKAKPPFYVRRMRDGAVDVLCQVNGKNGIVFVSASKNCRIGKSCYVAMKKTFSED